MRSAAPLSSKQAPITAAIATVIAIGVIVGLATLHVSTAGGSLGVPFIELADAYAAGDLLPVKPTRRFQTGA